MRIACLHVTFAWMLLFTSTSRAFAEPSGEPGNRDEQGEERIVNWWSLDYGPNAKDANHRGWPAPFGFALVNFAVFAALIGRFAGPPLKEFLRDRHHRIRHDLDEAARLAKEARAELEEYRRKVASIDNKIEELLSGIHKEAEAEKARLIAAAETEAARLRDEAERQIGLEVDRARFELRRQVVEAASRIAGDLLHKQTSTADHRRMADEFVGRLEQSNLTEKRT